MSFMMGVFWVIMAGIGAGTISEIAKAIARRGPSASELADLRRRVDEQAAALDEAQHSLGSQAAQLEELHERVDFAERLLAEVRHRPGLEPGRGAGG